MKHLIALLGMSALSAAAFAYPQPIAINYDYHQLLGKKWTTICATDYTYLDPGSSFQPILTARGSTARIDGDLYSGGSARTIPTFIQAQGEITSGDLRVVKVPNGDTYVYTILTSTLNGRYYLQIDSFILQGNTLVSGGPSWVQADTAIMENASLADDQLGRLMFIYSDRSKLYSGLLEKIPTAPYYDWVRTIQPLAQPNGLDIVDCDISINRHDVFHCAMITQSADGMRTEYTVGHPTYTGGIILGAEVRQFVPIGTGSMNSCAIAASERHDPTTGPWPKNDLHDPKDYAIVTDFFDFASQQSQIILHGRWSFGRYTTVMNTEYGFMNTQNSWPDIDSGTDYYEVAWLSRDDQNTFYWDSAGSFNIMSRGIYWNGRLVDEFDPTLYSKAYKRASTFGQWREYKTALAIDNNPAQQERTMAFANLHFGTNSVNSFVQNFRTRTSYTP